MRIIRLNGETINPLFLGGIGASKKVNLNIVAQAV